MDFHTPVGRIVQGSVAMQAQKDVDTNQPLKNDDGSPVMGTFIALAFPKVLPNGQRNTEFDQFFALLSVAARSWPALFPQVPAIPETSPVSRVPASIRGSRTSTRTATAGSSGKSVASKPGFASATSSASTSYWCAASRGQVRRPREVGRRNHQAQVLGPLGNSK